MSHISVILDLYQYCPGQTISGKLVCTFRSSKQVKKVRIRLRGFEHTKWSETERDHRRKKFRTVFYSGENDIILKDEMVHSEGTIDRGQHEFPFSFYLPVDLPSTFVGTWGYVKYFITATVNRAIKTDMEDTKEIVIISPINLQNVPPNFQKPAQSVYEAPVGCFGCFGAPLELSMSLEKQAFLLGDTINITIVCNNRSNVKINEVTAKLTREIGYQTTYPSVKSKQESKEVVSSWTTGVEALEQKTLTIFLNIPRTAVVPNFSRCTLLRCDYKLRITADTASGFSRDMSLTTYVILGHMPHSSIVTAPPVSQFKGTSNPIGNSSLSGPMPVASEEPLATCFDVPFSGPSLEKSSKPLQPPHGSHMSTTSNNANAPIDNSQVPSAPLQTQISECTDDIPLETFDGRTPPPTYEESAKDLKFPQVHDKS